MNEDYFDVEQGLQEDPMSGLNASEAVQQIEGKLQEAQQYAEAEEAAIDEEQEELVDPREKESWGVKGVAKELSSAVTGGLQDTVSSVTTFPERALDMFSGEWQRERKERGYYQPEWDPATGNGENPIITKTWWGKLARGVVHFGSMSAAILGTAAVAAKAGVGLGIGAGAKALLGANSLVRAAGVGAISDLISKESDGHNALGSLRDHYGWMDTPLSTQEEDHPMMMKLKNIVEGMGIGLVFDGAFMAIGKGKKSVAQYVQKRGQSQLDQSTELGLKQLRDRERGFRAAKNRPLAEPHQGAYFSEDDPYDVWVRDKKIRENWGSEEGAGGNVVTAVQRTRGAQESGLSEDVVDNVLKKLYSNNKYKNIIDEVKAKNLRLVDVFGDAIAAHQRITLGRNAADMSPEAYLEELFRATDAYEITDIDGNIVDKLETMTSKYVVVADMVVGTLLQQVRDMGIAGRELANFVDIADVDGPLEAIRDTMFMALTEAKRARIIKSQNFRELDAGVKRSYLKRTLDADMADTREAIQSILNINNNSDDTNLLMALFEAFSSMQTVNSLDDFDAWARKMVKGGTIEGKNQTGALIRELQGVMIHSVLSGPKTPLRAIIGTSTHTFLRPFATTLGGLGRLPFTGDTRTIRAGLASMNAMMEAIPESFELFKTRLNSYWSGEIATVKTRFSEYTQGDDNWEILRRWAESDRASAGDKAAFAMANMARSMNDKNFLTYGTKLMAATDDAFAFILGRAKMREKALMSAFDAQQAGALADGIKINPALIRSYEDYFYSDIFDADGNIVEGATKFARQEVTLTQDLSGFAANLNAVFQQNPWAKPFFLFARTGVNGLALTAKHTPGFNFLVREFNDIAFAKPGKLTDELASKYGIMTDQDLINAKALQTGRLMMGASLVSMASWAWMTGRMTGNGPIDRQQRQAWIDGGFKARTLFFGDIGVEYDSFEPFNQIMSMIADIGDASQLMGEEWTKDNLLKMALLLSQGVTSKSYLAGMQSFVDIFSGKPGQVNRVVAGLINNQVPLAGLRASLGNIFSQSGVNELQSGIIDSIRNRNRLSENFAGMYGGDLPKKTDILNGQRLQPWNFIERTWNATIPVNFVLKNSPGRSLLQEGYDTRLITMFSPDGDDLSDSPNLRAIFQEEMGKEKLEAKLNRLARDPRIIASVNQRRKDMKSGDRTKFENKDYFHNIMIKKLFREAKGNAWARMVDLPEVLALQKANAEATIKRNMKTDQTTYSELLKIYK